MVKKMLNFAYEVSLWCAWGSVTCRKILRHGTDRCTSPPKEGVLRVFIVLKNPNVLAGFELANLESNGEHATTRPPRAARRMVPLKSRSGRSDEDSSCCPCFRLKSLSCRIRRVDNQARRCPVTATTQAVTGSYCDGRMAWKQICLWKRNAFLYPIKHGNKMYFYFNEK
jgi:hypothetical protein